MATDPAPSPTAAEGEGDFEVPQRRNLALISIAEAVSYLVLLAFSIWHRGFDGPDLAPITGPIHGFLFLGYVGLVLWVRQQVRWGLVYTLVLLAASVVPFGGFFVARRLEQPDPARPPAALA